MIKALLCLLILLAAHLRISDAQVQARWHLFPATPSVNIPRLQCDSPDGTLEFLFTERGAIVARAHIPAAQSLLRDPGKTYDVTAESGPWKSPQKWIPAKPYYLGENLDPGTIQLDKASDLFRRLIPSDAPPLRLRVTPPGHQSIAADFPRANLDTHLQKLRTILDDLSSAPNGKPAPLTPK